jgi:hypothetical protein
MPRASSFTAPSRGVRREVLKATVNMGNAKKAVLPELTTKTRFTALLSQSVMLGAFIGLATGLLFIICLMVFGWVRSLELSFRWLTLFNLVVFAYMLVVTALLGAISGIFVAAVFWILVRLRLRKEFAGVVASLVVGWPLNAMVFLVVIASVAMDGGLSSLEMAALLVLALISPIAMAAVHGWLLARWAYRQESRELRVRFLLMTLGGIVAFFLVVSIALGTVARLEERRYIRTWREEAAISPEVARDVCAKLALSPKDSRCREGADVRAHDFFPEIRGLADKGMTYEQIEETFGAYKVSCGATLHKEPGDEGYFVCLYDLKGNEKYWFTFEFTTGGSMTRVSTSSAPPPP